LGAAEGPDSVAGTEGRAIPSVPRAIAEQQVPNVLDNSVQDTQPEAADLSPSPASLLRVLQIAARRKSLMALAVVSCLVLGALYYGLAPRVYEARAQVLVIKKRPDSVPGLDPTRGGNEDYLATQAGIIKSPVVIARANAPQDPNRPPLGALPSFRGKEDLTTMVLAQLRVTRDPKDPHNSILEVSLRASSEDDSAAGLADIIDAYKGFLDETYQNVSDETVKLVTRIRDELEKDLDRKEKDFRDFRLSVPVHLLRGTNGNSFNGDLLLLIHSKQLDVQLRRREIEGRLKAFEDAWNAGRDHDTLIAMLSRLNSQSNRAPLTDSQGRLVSDGIEDKLMPALLEEKMLLQDYGPNHPDVQATHQKVELARQFVVECLKHEADDLKRSEELLASSFDEHLGEAKKGVAYDVEDDTYRSDILRVQQLYDITVRRLQDADIIKDLGGFDAQVVGPPTARQVWPKSVIVFPVALVLGLMGGFGLAYTAEVTDRTFRSAEEIRKRLGLAVVGHIPSITLKKEALEVIAAGGSALDPILCAHHRPRSREAESYRGVRTSLYFSTRAGGHKVIQVTSPRAGDGKSTLAANVAISVAQSGKRTLLVDADLRKPRAHKLFGLSPGAGLSSVIRGECPAAEAVQATEVPGLSVLPCGPVPPNPAELLTSPRFQELVQELREQYDFILIDTPPLLAVTDPAVVTPRVDGVLLTLRITRNGRPDAERAKGILDTLGAPVLGVVVNGVTSRGPGYGGYGYGDYYYGDYQDAAAGKKAPSDDGYYQDEEAGAAAEAPAQEHTPGRNGKA
jgi:capsular exopolysaccharide synthesis family protein